MPLNRPSIPTLLDRIIADIRGRLPGTDPLLRHSLLGVIARVLAGAVHGLYGAIAFAARQIVPTQAEAEYLDRWASLWLDEPRLPAAAAVGEIAFTGQADATVPLGTLYHAADGAEYETTEEIVLDGAGEGSAAARAVDAGAAGNADAGLALTASAPVAGVDATAAVAAGGMTGGADEESDDALRERLRLRIQDPPHGGTRADYERWAREVLGVDRVWVTPLYDGDGTVRVWIGDDDYGGADLADAALVAEVQDYIDDRRPVTADVTAAAPTKEEVDIELSLVPDTADVRAAVETELARVFERDAVPEGTVLLSHIREAISIAEGETNHTLTAPAADVTAAAGNILTLGQVTYV